MKVTKYYILFLTGILIFLSTTAYLIRGTESSFSLSGIFSTTEPADSSLVPVNVQDPGIVRVEDHSKTIKFNHKFHIVDQGVACKDCHVSASSSDNIKDDLNPKMEVCATCHDVKDEKNCSFCHYDNNNVKIKATHTHLLFSHKSHIETQKAVCTDCHKGIDKVIYAKESPGEFPAMEKCITCHTGEKATNNCSACHTKLTGLTPQSHLQSNYLNEHTFQTGGVSNANNKCMMCHTDNYCQVCHSAPQYQGQNSKNNFFVPYYTKEGATRTDRADLQKLTSVHNLNYKYTHGLDANSKSFECKTCHDPVTFCASCHENGGENLTGVLPQSHLQPGFTTIGVNTGGGIHSQLARKDIESCQSCHDAEGSDPVCVKCHYDNDGIKGTHPRTHEPNFLHDENGIWHTTQGAVCYTCHTDANAKPNGVKGVGFCGYCHAK